MNFKSNLFFNMELYIKKQKNATILRVNKIKYKKKNLNDIKDKSMKHPRNENVFFY